MSGADHLRRLALQIAAQLPDDEIEARYVLERAGDVIGQLAHAPRLQRVNLPGVPPHQILRLIPAGDREDQIGPRDKASPE